MHFFFDFPYGNPTCSSRCVCECLITVLNAISNGLNKRLENVHHEVSKILVFQEKSQKVSCFVLLHKFFKITFHALWNLFQWKSISKYLHSVWKLLKMSHLLIFQFCPIRIDPSGNTVWPQASGFQKLAPLAMLNETFSLIFKHRAVCYSNFY